MHSNNIQYFLLCISFNILLFTSYILTIGVKFINSPSFDIIDYLQRNSPGKYNEIINLLDKNLILKNRFSNLKNEKMIYEKNNNFFLTSKGIAFCKSFSKIKKFFNLKVEG